MKYFDSDKNPICTNMERHTNSHNEKVGGKSDAVSRDCKTECLREEFIYYSFYFETAAGVFT